MKTIASPAAMRYVIQRERVCVCVRERERERERDRAVWFGYFKFYYFIFGVL